ncbi:SMC-Scp complex subunit ScpB [Methylocystis parvus]|uniref:SMC-Scp complex subunit ScpB n=1 Tax=Methylocystis parvus TaxID=134 RepID=A0A6B8MC66_9HYPH|nr:SMC-Scp complex subunit ScpB [Methylocystis parvus]QGM99209.1 SMC-Scp complex subunit ScpB [Methylocystis parvus]WBK00411.1 SMC-Scp complex subunit ScpB [Methylocystis parvus OBBP]
MAQPAEKIELFDVNSDEALARNEVALREAERIVEAMLFAAAEPLDETEMERRVSDEVDLSQALERLKAHYANRGVNLTRVGRKWFFRTAADLNWILAREQVEEKKLSRAALETLAIIAYHQPATRAEIEEIRGVAISKGTLDTLLETGWIRLRGRRKAPGRPITYGTTDAFLMHFGLEQIGDLPGLDELKAAGLFDGRLPKGFGVPQPSDDTALRDDEDPLEDDAPQALEMDFPEEPEPIEAPEASNDD